MLFIMKSERNLSQYIIQVEFGDVIIVQSIMKATIPFDFL